MCGKRQAIIIIIIITTSTAMMMMVGMMVKIKVMLIYTSIPRQKDKLEIVHGEWGMGVG